MRLIALRVIRYLIKLQIVDVRDHNISISIVSLWFAKY